MEQVRGEADRALCAGDAAAALHLYTCLVEASPHDWEARIRVADALDRLGEVDAARTAYQAAGEFAAAGGHPLPAIVAGRALWALDGQSGPGVALLQQVAALYASDSGRVGRRGARVSVPHGIALDERRLANVAPIADRIEAALRVARTAEGVRFPQDLHGVPFLSSLPREAFARVLGLVRLLRLRDGDLVVREGDPGDSLFLCAVGRVVVFKADGRELGRLSEGAIFGEMALLTGAPRGASVRAEGPADVLEIGRKALSDLAAAVPGVGEALDRYRRERLLMNLLQVSPLFRPFSAEQRVDLLHRFEGIEAVEGEVVIRQGEEGRGLYVILDGECEVTRESDGIDVEVARLGPGDVFGEISLLHEVPATATVAVARHATLLALPAEAFRRLIEGVPDLRAYFAELAADRLRRTGNLLGDEVLLQISDGLLL